MKKIILAFDGSNFSASAFEFARRLNDIEPIMVTGVFIPQVDYASLWSYSAAVGMGAGPAYIPLPDNEEDEVIEKNIHLFEDLCTKNDIKFRAHKDYNRFVLGELKKESRFADVMIISGELFYHGVNANSQFDYIRDLLHTAECPVLILPEKVLFPDNNILAYDGTPESVYAIKQFYYIFNEITSHPTLLIYADIHEDATLPMKDYIIELASQHFPNIEFSKVEVDVKKHFKEWIDDKKSSILVSGSFGRSPLSQLVNKSFVADIIKEHKMPVFIAHR